MGLITKTCCFIGHRKVENKEIIYRKTKLCINNLIINERASTFLFGSRSEFDDLCLEIVTELKNTYSYINRIYVRSNYEYIEPAYENYLFKIYDDSFYANKAHGANKLSYIKRNEEMVDKSDICIFYFINNNPHSGTAITYNYAKQHKKKIILI